MRRYRKHRSTPEIWDMGLVSHLAGNLAWKWQLPGNHLANLSGSMLELKVNV